MFIPIPGKVRRGRADLVESDDGTARGAVVGCLDRVQLDRGRRQCEQGARLWRGHT